MMLTVGWREWAALPELGVPAIKVKVDTGARSSALHAYYVEPFGTGKRPRVRFGIHPLQRRTDVEIHCEAEVVDRRMVTDSGGHRERRIVIVTPIRLGDVEWSIEVTLAKRDSMLFRMLLGRTAADGRLLIDPGESYMLGRVPARTVYRRLLRSRRKFPE